MTPPNEADVHGVEGARVERHACHVGQSLDAQLAPCRDIGQTHPRRRGGQAEKGRWEGARPGLYRSPLCTALDGFQNHVIDIFIDEITPRSRPFLLGREE